MLKQKKRKHFSSIVLVLKDTNLKDELKLM